MEKKEKRNDSVVEGNYYSKCSIKLTFISFYFKIFFLGEPSRTHGKVFIRMLQPMSLSALCLSIISNRTL